MKCKSAERLLPEYIEGVLPPKKVDQLINHIEKCSHCEKELKAFEKAIRLTSNLPVEYPTPEKWEAFASGLHMQITQSSEPESDRFPIWLRQHAGKMMGAVCLLVVLLGISGIMMFKSHVANQTVSLDELILHNMIGEISVTQLRAQLSHELQNMDGVFNPTGSNAILMVDEIQPQKPSSSRELIHQLSKVIATEIDLNYFGAEEFINPVSSTDSNFVLASLDWVD